MRLCAFTSILFALMACGTPPDSSTVETNDVVNAASSNTEDVQIRRQLVSNSGGELTCMQQCGQEARGTVYVECLEDGGDREECGHSGRQWYRECLETRCGEAAVEFDDCRTDCRAEAKPNFEQCLSESDEQTCRSAKREEIDSCLSDCER